MCHVNVNLCACPTHVRQVLIWALSGVSQTIVHSMLEGWGPTGLDTHLRRLQWMYTVRRNRLHTAASKHLNGLATWTLPSAGMFLWMDVSPSGVVDTFNIVDRLLDAGVVMVPGGAFSANPHGPPCSCFRASYTQLTDDDSVDRGMRRLAAVLSDIKANQTLASTSQRGPIGSVLGAQDSVNVLSRKQREAADLEARLAELRHEISLLETSGKNTV